MKTPVYDFVQSYIQSDFTRFHMPGHKGTVFLGCEPSDITEITGADVLAESEGILGESQKNASSLFHTGATFYSTEGSSQCIKTMLAAALLDWKRKHTWAGHRPWVLAARNIHRSMVDACALLDMDIRFLSCFSAQSICLSQVTAREAEESLASSDSMPVGLYLTSPDYLGQEADIAGIAGVCRRYQIPLLVDNAHGAYSAFLRPSRHPIAQGAALCCDSAHKTLPVLTGGAYLHMAEEWMPDYKREVRHLMNLFGSTSPSYLILQSLDLCNRYLSEGYPQKLQLWTEKVEKWKQEARRAGIAVMNSEPLKIVIDAGKHNCTGFQVSRELQQHRIECEYSDKKYVVLMTTPENTEQDLDRLRKWKESTALSQSLYAEREYSLCSSSQDNAAHQREPKRGMTIREAVFAPSEIIAAEKSLGRILADETVSCPPAIPIGISGEIIDEEMIQLFQEYDIRNISVVRL